LDRLHATLFNSDTFFWTEFTPRQGFTTVDAYGAYLARFRDVPRYFDEPARSCASSFSCISQSSSTPR
jgi:hypothetical protein